MHSPRKTNYSLVFLGGNAFTASSNVRLASEFKEVLKWRGPVGDCCLFSMSWPSVLKENPVKNCAWYDYGNILCMVRALHEKARAKAASKNNCEVWVIACSIGATVVADAFRDYEASIMPDGFVFLHGCFSVRKSANRMFWPLKLVSWLVFPEWSFNGARSMSRILENKEDRTEVYVISSESDELTPSKFVKESAQQYNWKEGSYTTVLSNAKQHNDFSSSLWKLRDAEKWKKAPFTKS